MTRFQTGDLIQLCSVRHSGIRSDKPGLGFTLPSVKGTLFLLLSACRQEVRPGPLEKAVAWAERVIAQSRQNAQAWHDRQIPILCGSLVQSPLMTLSTGRSMTAFAMDIHRIPDKVQAVMDAMVDDLTENAIATSSLLGIPGVDLVLERGGGFYFPLKVFERFEMPYIKRMVNAFTKKGFITMLHFDQDWTLNLPYLLDLPKKMCICELDSKTDIFEAKRILGNHMCIMGDVPPGLLSFGTSEETSAYCQKLIDEIGKDTGFILSTGCSLPLDARWENFKAMIDTGKNYQADWMNKTR